MPHNHPADDPFPFSHAYFPRDAFAEVIERNGWLLGRKDDGYVALYSQHALRWYGDQHAVGNPINEAQAAAPTNGWIIELGNMAQWGTFAAFVNAVVEASITFSGAGHELAVGYESPTAGEVRFGWHGELLIRGEAVALHDYPRFDNPYCQAEFGTRQYTVRYGAAQHTIDFG